MMKKNVLLSAIIIFSCLSVLATPTRIILRDKGTGASPVSAQLIIKNNGHAEIGAVYPAYF